MLMVAPDPLDLEPELEVEVDPRKPFDARLLLRYFDSDMEDEMIGEILGVGRSTVNKWRNGKSHMVGVYRADVLACRIGKHPAIVWGRLWWTAD